CASPTARCTVSRAPSGPPTRPRRWPSPGAWRPARSTSTADASTPAPRSAATSSPASAANSAPTDSPSTSRPSPSSSKGVVTDMAVRAAVLPAVSAPLEITGIELPDPGPGEVRVRLAAAGVCHSDLSLTDGTMRLPVPAVLGHEGAGTVVSVGEGVTGVAPGDEVVLNWAPSCGACPACARGEVWLCGSALDGAARVHAHRADDGTDLHPGLNVAAFAEETVVPRSCVLPAPAGVPLTDAALLGCAVLTGYGAVHHAARVRPGETVAVFGVGGVGLAALQSARIAGASTIVAVDVSPDKEGLARAAGATDYLVASDTTPRQIRALTGKQGVDVAVECVGRAVTI